MTRVTTKGKFNEFLLINQKLEISLFRTSSRYSKGKGYSKGYKGYSKGKGYDKGYDKGG